MKNLSRVLLFLLLIAFAWPLPGKHLARAQERSPSQVLVTEASNKVELHQALLDLGNPWTVMCVAAHPDDEDGTTLTVLRRKYGVHTVSVFSTFGEGGQNAIGPELYEELGAIRARETMAAAEIQGSEPYFLGLKDFGYSKSAAEAFQVWGHDEALRRMVLKIRELRPDVIITNHDTSSGHGHHQATGRLILEAFEVAADPKRFPEQLKGGVTTWQVERLFLRVGFGNAAQKPDTGGGLVSIDPNERDPIRDTTYAEEALRALQQHATQGPWPRTVADLARFRNSPDGKLPLIRYRLVREAKGTEPLPTDSHYPLDGLRLPENIAKQLAPPTIEGKPLTEFVDQRERVLGALMEVKKNRTALGDEQRNHTSRVYRKTTLIDHALGLAAGLRISITPANPILVPNSTMHFLITISNEGTTSPWVIATHLDTGDSRIERFFEIIDKHPYQIEPGKTTTLTLTYRAPAAAPITIPHSEHLYDGRLFTQLAEMNVYLKLKGVEVPLNATASFDVAPAVEIADVIPSPLVVTPAMSPNSSGILLKFMSRTMSFKARLINHQDSGFSGQLIGGNLKDKSAQRRDLRLAPKQESILRIPATGSFAIIDFGKTGAHPIPNVISLTLIRNGAAEPITTKRVHVVWADAHVAPNLRVGYIRGFDYSLPNALAALGVESKELTLDEVRAGDLQKYNAIIVDNRVYESEPELIAANQRLLDYAKDGGTLIVFYHKSNEWNPDSRRNRPQLAPYKLILGDDRITDENAPVTFIEPQHPLLNFPNKLGQEDFAGWIQERGLYYPKDWDGQFHALLQSNDPGEQPLRGGLLVADYGRGRYIYTSMVWYRQLRAGVPGAYRMFANMISYGHSR